MSQIAEIKELRQKTGLGLIECVKALSATGSIAEAEDYLRNNGHEFSDRVANRTAGVGRIHSYVHHNGRVGSLVSFVCESDFVAESVDFREFMKQVCIHVAGTKVESVTELLLQPFVMNPDQTVIKLVVDISRKVGEKVEIVDVKRLEFLGN